MSGEIYLKEVNNETLKAQFIDFAYNHYKGCEHYIAPLRFDIKNNLDTQKNPFYQHSRIKLWLAFDDGKIVGRIAAIVNDNHNNFHKDKVGFFGFFESINNRLISNKLFDAATSWLKDQGMDTIRGPVNPSTNDECGLLVNAFDTDNVILMPYNFEFYEELILNAGFTKSKDLHALWISKDVIKDEKVMEKLRRIAEIVMKRENIKIRKVNLRDFDNEVQRVRDVYNNAWSDNWGFVPMTEDEFRYIAKNLKIAVNPEFVEFAEIDGQPIGFSLAIPDLNQAIKGLNGKLFPFGIFKFLSGKKRINRLRVIIMGMKHEYQKKGIDGIFYKNLIENGNRLNYIGAEISWVLDDNMPMMKTAENLGAKIYKTYRIFDKKI
ncbi:hypothetical protein FBQ84_00890 [Ignavibacteria bacterium CHB1]|nr:MAG: hypothetical protein EDM69_01365 [Chlorobiota bacterium]KXK01660.1 MAG: hypothetical protein UZ04_CHB001002230 [Chlorobi bacterium OLB4]MBV6398682.1 hypothetical protein [Ignavibacteria bacterium]MCC6885150.1 hypothetical protein [Ignavibacteriales bacterium]MCE7952060.1 hypothetical protein [Chlorobi bacterium CHB7]MDL1886383.1 hypothetical protein [Ignavibacteria bacterium CHB1]OQY77652.1 MAG: hypothetical protein B6D43_03875 [Ignavibacteriales bacterium UTCHB1]RIK48828.1 MAG: hypo